MAANVLYMEQRRPLRVILEHLLFITFAMQKGLCDYAEVQVSFRIIPEKNKVYQHDQYSISSAVPIP